MCVVAVGDGLYALRTDAASSAIACRLHRSPGVDAAADRPVRTLILCV